jgi:imidazolonepropionase-like amidohydrolase
MDRREFVRLAAMTAAGVAVTSCTSLTPRHQAPEKHGPTGERLLLVNASIVDVVQGKLRPETAILITDGKVAEILATESIPGINADRTVDLGGAFVIPGLINAHCHMTLPGAISMGAGMLPSYSRQIERNAEECVKHGVTTVRDMMAIAGPMKDLLKKISRGEIAAPRIARSCALDVQNGYTKTTAIIYAPAFWQPAGYPIEARESVRTAKERGAHFIKIFQQDRELIEPGRKLPRMDLRTVQAVCDEAAKLGMTVAMHHTDALGLMRGIEGPVNSFEHMTRERTLTPAEVEKAAKSGIFFIPTASVAFSLAFQSPGDLNWGREPLPRMVEERKRMFPSLVKEFSEPELVDGMLKIFAMFSDPSYFAQKHITPVPSVKVFSSAATVGTENLLKLKAAGVQFGCGNDGGVPMIFPGAMSLEMTLMEEAGFTPAEVLKAATANNAKILRMEDTLGSVDKGKIADLVVLEKNPLETSRNTAHPKMVFQGGRMVYKATA